MKHPMAQPSPSSSAMTKPACIYSLLLGISSGIGFATMNHLLKNPWKLKIPNKLKRMLKGIYQKGNGCIGIENGNGNGNRIESLVQNRNGIDWSTLLLLYTITQLKAKHASIVIPFLYLLLGNNDRDHHNNYDNNDNDKNDGTAGHGNETINGDVNGNNTSIENIEIREQDSDEESKQKQEQEQAEIHSKLTEPPLANTATIHINADNMLLKLRQQQQQQQQPSNEYRSRSNSVLTQTDASEVSTATDNDAKPVRYLEILVHNVAHTDLVLCLGIPPELQSNGVADVVANATARTPLKNNSKQKVHFQKEEAHALCRPRFSAFDMFCRRILHVLHNSNCNHHCMDDGGSSEGIHKRHASNQHASERKSGPEVRSPQTIHDEKEEKIRQLYASIMSFPKYERSDSTARFSLVTPKPSKQTMLPVGFNLAQLIRDEGKDSISSKVYSKELALTQEDVASLRVRGKDMVKMEGVVAAGCWPSTSLPQRKNERGECAQRDYGGDGGDDNDRDSLYSPLHLEAIFFPLLSSLLRRWHNQIVGKYGSILTNKVKKVLVLVSGVGTPRNWTHSITGNSTEACAELMEMFIKVLYPDVVVVRLHSQREIFRYDENITFANEELLPCIDAYRDAHARGERYPDEVVDGDWATTRRSTNPFDPDWKQTVALTLSFADGAPARTHAIQSSLRPYRPTYFHFWQLKTFWHDSKICDDDIEVHSFESMETVPAMEVQKTNSDVQCVVEEMKKFRQDFVKTLGEGDNDIRKFWLRKTKKPVLAVLLMNRPGKGLITYRGMNMEVSMPTGSLCAERNVIGTALATNPNLRREDLMMVAVLAVPLIDDGMSSNAPPQLPSPPPGVNQDFCTIISPRNDSNKGTSVFFNEVEEKLSKYQRPENLRRSMSIGSFTSIVEGSDSNETDDSSWDKMPAADRIILETPPPISNMKSTLASIAHQSPNSEIISDSNSNSGVSTPIRKIKLYGGGEAQHEFPSKSKLGNYKRKKKRTVVVHSSEDINPLKPCGACNEWLKKIAESNPYFKVVTFTDTDCNGVYVTPCQE